MAAIPKQSQIYGRINRTLPLIDRRSHSVLRDSLPEKEEFVILVKMSPIQRQLYSAFMDTLREEHMDGWMSTNPLKAFAVCCKVTTTTFQGAKGCVEAIIS